MKLSVEMLPNYRIAYLRKIGPYGADNSQTMEALKAWAREVDLLNQSSIILGIPQDDPTTTNAEDCRYDTCLVISEAFIVDGETILVGESAGGKFVVFEIDHTTEGVREAWKNIFIEIGKMGFAIDASRPIMERYAAVKLEKHKCEICVPVN